MPESRHSLSLASHSLSLAGDLTHSWILSITPNLILISLFFFFFFSIFPLSFLGGLCLFVVACASRPNPPSHTYASTKRTIFLTE